MQNYVIKIKSSYTVICQYSCDKNIKIKNIFDKIKLDSFLIGCYSNDLIKTNDNLNLSGKCKKYVLLFNQRFDRMRALGGKHKYSSVFNKINLLVLYDEKIYNVKILNGIIEIIGLSNLKNSTEICTKIINKISEDVSTNVNMGNITTIFITMNFDLTHSVDFDIFNGITDGILYKNFFKIKSTDGTMFIFKTQKLVYCSGKNVMNEDNIIKYINEFFSTAYKCSPDCNDCKKVVMVDEIVNEENYVQTCILYI